MYKKRVLFCLPNSRLSYPIHPLGVTKLGAILRRDGMDVKLVDMDAEKIGTDGLTSHLNSFRPDVVGISYRTASINHARAICECVKAFDRSIRVVVGGADVTARTLDSVRDVGADIGVVGEGEDVVSSVMFGSEDLSDIKGLVLKDRSGDLRFTGEREPIRDLDAYPYTAYDLLDLDRYRTYPINLPQDYLTMITSRGCPMSCNFCFNSMFGRYWRGNSAKYVVDEIEYCIETLPLHLRSILFVDDSFTVDKQRIYDLCEQLKRRDIDLTYKFETRVDLVDEKLLRTMHDVGFTHISFGVECLHPSTNILTEQGYLPIDEVHSSLLSINPETKKLNCAEGVPFVKNCEEPLLTLSTSNNSLICTKNHRLFVLNDEGLVEKYAKDIHVDEYVAVVKKQCSYEGKNTIGTEKAELLGYFAGDGYLDINEHKRRYRFRITDADVCLLEYYAQILKKITPHKVRIIKENKRNNNYILIYDKELCLWLKGLGLNRYSGDKIIPNFIYTLPSAEQFAFLRGLFDADGSVSISLKGNGVVFETASRALATQIKMLLLSYGIYSDKNKEYTNKYGVWYRVRIRRHEAIKRFSELVGSNSGLKHSRLTDIGKQEFYSNRGSHRITQLSRMQSRNNVVPLTKGMWKTLLRDYETTTYKLQTKHNINLGSYVYQKGKERHPSKMFLRRLFSVLGDSSKSPLGSLLKEIITSDIFFEKIVYKEETPYRGLVYDFSVSGYRNYVANGFLVHNSGNEYILKEWNKQISKDRVRDAFRIAHKIGYCTTAYMIIGAPSETPRTIQDSIDFAKEIDADFVQWSIAAPIPGTKLTEWFEREYGKITDWSGLYYSNVFTESRAYTNDTNYHTKHMSNRDLIRWQKRAYRDTYFNCRYVLKRLRRMRNMTEIEATINGFREMLRAVL